MKDSEIIYISPVNFIDEELLKCLSEELYNVFTLPCSTLPLEADLSFAFNTGRRQYHSSLILSRLRSEMPGDGLRILIVVNVDCYVPELNFVFGEVEVGGPAALISLVRLRPEYYGRKPDRFIFKERAVKEAVHELGHTFGLSHCVNPTCVMFFSNSLLDTDHKKSRFCRECRSQL